MEARRRILGAALALVCAAVLVHCASSERSSTTTAEPDAEPEASPTTPVVEAAVADVLTIGDPPDDDAASTAAAVFDCKKGGCPDDAGDSACIELSPCTVCEQDAGTCTGGPGFSIAVCPYRYRYCIGLGSCVTTARYYALCPY